MLASLRQAGLLALVLCACEDKTPPVPTGPARAASLEGIDAGLLAEGALATDPPAPAGDLRAELDGFVNLDACVAERAKLDPLVGDALGAIGYDTFLRDACRMLEAAKDKKRETCARIDSSPLRRQCESWVAMIAQSPDGCPLQYDGIAARGRPTTCVAVAARDVRLCGGEVRSAARATCEALVLRDPKGCATLLPNARASCVRETTRWKNVLSAPLEGLAPLAVPRATLTLKGDDPDAGADAGTASVIDVTDIVANGVVVVTARDRVRVEVGALVESELSRIAAIPQKRPRVGFSILGDAKSGHLEKIELVLPNDAPFVSPPASCNCKISGFDVGPRRGSTARVHIEGTITNGTRSQPIAVDVTTWVRDVVSDDHSQLRTIPAYPRLGRDGG